MHTYFRIQMLFQKNFLQAKTFTDSISNNISDILLTPVLA